MGFTFHVSLHTWRITSYFRTPFHRLLSRYVSWLTLKFVPIYTCDLSRPFAMASSSPTTSIPIQEPVFLQFLHDVHHAYLLLHRAMALLPPTLIPNIEPTPLPSTDVWNQPDGLRPHYSDLTNAFIDGVHIPSPDIAEEEALMNELLEPNLPEPHQHVAAPPPDALPEPSKLSTTASTPPKRKQKAKATPKAPAKRRRLHEHSRSRSSSPLSTWTLEDKQKLRTLKSDEKSRFSWRVISTKMGKSEEDVRSMWNKLKDKLGWPPATWKQEKDIPRHRFTMFYIQLRLSHYTMLWKSNSTSQHFVTTVSLILATLTDLNLLYSSVHTLLQPFIMSLRTHLDRYCQQRAMANDRISPTRRSRSPTRAPSSTTGSSPFQRPPGWTPPSTTPHRPVILQLDLKPMQQLAARNPYYNILTPKVAGNLTTETYDSLFQTFKVIYPDYARSHFVSDLKTVVTDTLLQRWSIHLQATDFYMMIDTDQGAQMLDDLPHSLLDILNWFYPSWKTHQHLDAFTSRECTPLLLTPHPDPQDTGFAVHIQVIPRGHPFVTATRYTKTAAWHPQHAHLYKKKKGPLVEILSHSVDHLYYQFLLVHFLFSRRFTELLFPSDVVPTSIWTSVDKFRLQFVSTLFLLLLYMADHKTDGVPRMIPALSSMTPTDGTNTHLRPDDPTTASYIPRAARMTPTSTTVHTIFTKKLSYPFTSRPDELWILERTADGRETWKPVEAFLENMHLTRDRATLRATANNWRQYYEIPIQSSSSSTATSFPVLPHPEHTNVHVSQPYEAIPDQLYILQSCWGRSAQHHSQGTTISLSWPPWRSTPPSSPSTTLHRTLHSNNPTTPVHHPHRPSPADEPGPMDMSDSSV